MQRKKVDIGVKSSDTKKRTTSKIPSSFTRHTTHRPIIRQRSTATRFFLLGVVCARANALVSTMRASRVHTAALSLEKTRSTWVFFLKNIHIYIHARMYAYARACRESRGRCLYNDIFSAVRAFVGAYARARGASKGRGERERESR